MSKIIALAILKTISGFRGTIGGKAGTNLTPVDIVACTAAYGTWINEQHEEASIIVGRDGRISGELVSSLAIQTLRSLGINVIDAGLSTTPSIEMAVQNTTAKGGIIFTASHNPKEWNALKLLNEKGEFISAADGKKILSIEADQSFEFVPVDKLGKYNKTEEVIADHISEILKLKVVDLNLIKSKNFHVVVDCINSTGAISIPPLLDKLNVTYSLINEEISGEFAHNPEPLPAHLVELSDKVVSEKAHLGIAVDPDVDRLAFMSEDGSFFGEEYTLVATADFILSKQKGPTVSNLSSSRALSDITNKHGQEYHAAAVGEVNVVTKMKDVGAVIGGEGNGGVIYPELHYGRDALVGIVFILQLLAEKETSMSSLRKEYNNYEIRKHKINLTPTMDVDNILSELKQKYANEKINTIDGLKIDMDAGWVHLRKSNTEPILRVYSESISAEDADKLAEMIKLDVQNLM